MSNQNSKINELEKRVTKIEERLVSIERILSSGDIQKAHPKALSIKEFLLMAQPDDDTQKTLTIGYFLENYLGYTSFNTSDIKEGFRNAKEVLPSNINDRVNKNINPRGYIMEVKEKKDGKKAWTLTNAGEKIIKNIIQDYESKRNKSN